MTELFVHFKEHLGIDQDESGDGAGHDDHKNPNESEPKKKEGSK